MVTFLSFRTVDMWSYVTGERKKNKLKGERNNKEKDH